MIKLLILHTDGKTAEIDKFQEKELNELLHCIQTNKMFWNKVTGRGIWINALTIRHIIAEKDMDNGTVISSKGVQAP